MSSAKAPLRVLITGAAGQIGYSLIPLLASGRVFGHDQPVILHLLDIEPAKNALSGVAMEIEDALFSLVHGVVPTTNVQEAFTNIDVAILLGGFPRKPGMTRADLLSKNSPIFIEQGKALNQFAKKTVKVLVVANPANTNCLIAASNAPDLPKSAFSALTRLDQNRAAFQIAKKLKVGLHEVKNVTIWGNHSKTMFPDLSTVLLHKENKDVPALSLLTNEEKWVKEEFIPTVQNRGTVVMEARGLSSAMSAAAAIADHLSSWILGTKPGESVSMGVWSDGSYGAPKDVIFSFPVSCNHGEWKIVQDLPVNDQGQAMLKVTGDELVAEKAEAKV